MKRDLWKIRMLSLLAAALVLWPLTARADAGTPLVWGTMFQMLLGNAILGILEGWLLARVFDLAARRCAGLLVMANYLSACVGLTLMSYLFHRFATDLYSGLRVTWLLIGAMYLFTLIVEWPLVALCFRGTKPWLAKSIKGSLLIQTVSYVLLFGGYWMLSGKSLYTDMSVVSFGQMKPPNGILVFFISSSDGDVYCMDLGSSADTKIAELNSTNRWGDYLKLKHSETDTNYWDLVAVMDGRQTVLLSPKFSSRQLIEDAQAWRTSQYWGWGTPYRVADATNSTWSFRWAHWPDVGMWARNGSTTVRVAYGTPFGGWSPYRAIHLPGDMALLQLEEQICLVDVAGRKIALVRKGYGVLAFQEDQINEPATEAQ